VGVRSGSPDAGVQSPAVETSAPAPPPPSPPAAGDARGGGRGAGPRPGQLTGGWRIVTAVTWGLVFVAFAAVWKVSRELGLATWWLGPIGEPQPVFVLLLPFVAPAGMVVAALNNARRLPVAGLIASAVTAAIAVADLDRVFRLALVELAIAGAGAAVSIASFAGLYRSVPEDRAVPADPERQNEVAEVSGGSELDEVDE
jgi:hypothetical protein